MKTTKFLYLISAAIILSILLVACGKTPAATSTQNPADTPVPGETTEVSVPTNPPKKVPADVPIMTDAYDLEVSNQFNIMYKVKAQIKDIVTFYQPALLEQGWDQVNNPDSVVGSMATMTRSKTNGDRININYQYNMVGEFTVVQIYLTRVAPTATP